MSYEVVMPLVKGAVYLLAIASVLLRHRGFLLGVLVFVFVMLLFSVGSIWVLPHFVDEFFYAKNLGVRIHDFERELIRFSGHLAVLFLLLGFVLLRIPSRSRRGGG